MSPTPVELQARRRPRASDLVAAVRSVDAAPSPQAQVEIQKWLQAVYVARGGGPIIGLFGHCYLGAPYVDHAIALDGVILDHYSHQQEVPAQYVPARPFAVFVMLPFGVPAFVEFRGIWQWIIVLMSMVILGVAAGVKPNFLISFGAVAVILANVIGSSVWGTACGTERWTAFGPLLTYAVVYVSGTAVTLKIMRR